jgi:hypothetical protein
MTIEAKWLGACKPGQKPGDIMMPGGMKMNIKDMLPTASNVAAPNGDVLSEIKTQQGQVLVALNWSQIIRAGAEKYFGIRTPAAPTGLRSVP